MGDSPQALFFVFVVPSIFLYVSLVGSTSHPSWEKTQIDLIISFPCFEIIFIQLGQSIWNKIKKTLLKDGNIYY